MRRTYAYLLAAVLFMAIAFQGCKTATTEAPADKTSMRLGFVLTTTDPETVFNAFRLANYAIENGDKVSVFLLGKGVELELIRDDKFDAQGLAKDFLGKGGNIMACGTCLKLRDSEGSDLCPRSTLKDLHELVRGSDRVLTF